MHNTNSAAVGSFHADVQKRSSLTCKPKSTVPSRRKKTALISGSKRYGRCGSATPTSAVYRLTEGIPPCGIFCICHPAPNTQTRLNGGETIRISIRCREITNQPDVPSSCLWSLLFVLQAKSSRLFVAPSNFSALGVGRV